MSTNKRNIRRRWIAPWKNSSSKPEIYHTCGRIVGRAFLLGDEEREHFRMLMRMCEKFTGCRVLSYCLMSNHFHILLEVTPVPEGGIMDEVLFERLGVFYGKAQIAEIAKEMEDAAAVRTMAAYIDLNPVRAGMVSDPADYRWSSYGEAVGGGKKGNGKKAREGLVRACMSHSGKGFERELESLIRRKEADKMQ